MQLHEIMQSTSVGMPAGPRRDRILFHYFKKILLAPFRSRVSHVHAYPGLLPLFRQKKNLRLVDERAFIFWDFYMQRIKHIPDNLPWEGGYDAAIGSSPIDTILVDSSIR